VQQLSFVFEVNQWTVIAVVHNDMKKRLMLELFELNLYFQQNELMREYYEKLIKFVFDWILVTVVEVLLNDWMIVLK